MTVLVGYASAHSSTQGIAREIADRLMKGGFRAVVRPLRELESVDSYEAFVLGSAIHDQAWLSEGARFLQRFEARLAKRPVWLFSVSSVGETTSFFGPQLSALIRRSRKECQALARARERIHPRDHRHFAGAIERGQWSRLGDLFLKICGGAMGDQRDWRDVDDWANGIALALQAEDHVRERRRLHLRVRGKP